MLEAESSPVLEPGDAEAPMVQRRLVTTLTRAVLFGAGLFVFILALESLKRGAGAYGSLASGLFRVESPAGALGLGWLLAYLFLSGSPVAALAVSLFAAGSLDALQTLMMITGSRLGASLVVLVTGLVYAARGRHSTEGVAVGVLSLLATAVIYLPAMALAYILVAGEFITVPAISATAPLTSLLDPIIDPIAGVMIDHISPLGLIGTGVLLLMGAFTLLDRALPTIHHESRALGRVERLSGSPQAMFLLGAGITSVTLSVSVSVSALVPLAARGVVRRERVVPYIMGANITTFVDTLVAALIVAGSAAFAIVLIEMVCVTFFSLLALALFYHPLERSLLRLQQVIMHNHRATAAFAAVLVLVPPGLLLLWC